MILIDIYLYFLDNCLFKQTHINIAYQHNNSQHNIIAQNWELKVTISPSGLLEECVSPKI